MFPAIVGYSQKSDKISKNWQLNYNLGFSQFYGDASNNGYFQKFSGEIAFGTGITVRKYLSPAFGLGFNFLYTGLKSHKEQGATGIPVNITLTGSYYDANVNLLVDFNTLFWGESDRKFSIYGIIGIGYGGWNTTLSDSASGGTISSGTTIGNTTFKSGAFVMPAGVGLNLMISDKWALNFEINLRTVLNDDVDVWQDGFKYDQPLYTSFGISYFINKAKRKKADEKRQTKSATVGRPIGKPVKTYNYRVQPDNKGTVSDISPIEPKNPVSAKIVGVVYRVQILAKRQNLPSIALLKEKYNIVGDIHENVQNGLHRYSTGEFKSYRDALQHSYLLKKNGVNDAFVVAYNNNKRVIITAEMKKQ